MKKLIFLFLLFISTSLLMFIGCTKTLPVADTTLNSSDKSDQEATQDLDGEELSFDDLEIEIPALFTSPVTLVTYANTSELIGRVSDYLNSVLSEIDDVIASNHNIDEAIFAIRAEDGVSGDVILGGVSYYDSVNEVKNTTESWGWQYDLFYGGPRPEGWTNAGSGGASFVADKTEELLLDALTGAGDCIEIHYKREILAVGICYRDCE